MGYQVILSPRSIREIIFKSYRIVYRLNHESRIVEVVRFWHGARGTPDVPGLPS